MIAPAAEEHLRPGLAPALTAVRARRGLVALLFALAVVGWWWTAEQMRGMNNGPWTGLGTFGWFLSVWVVMMAAMMLPSVTPTIALYARMTKQRSPLSPLLFATLFVVNSPTTITAIVPLLGTSGPVSVSVQLHQQCGACSTSFRSFGKASWAKAGMYIFFVRMWRQM